MNEKIQVTMPLWNNPENYMGPNYKDYYVLYSRTRDSSILENCNYELIMEELNAETWDNYALPEKPMVIDIRHSHWAVGWVEFILVHKDCKAEILEKAQALALNIGKIWT